ncbi:cytochrome P450 [Frankia sp. Mgl5]|uniref:cytochrome P450 n=1 Tax=Frankia sp. Mgl5 TaxID=2933793 RepID=UPI00200E0093|nr:cytochrome P450 [Frankia sp. Mgl5]MCK9931140.1 cytochrome P450 [Frankia sp. Mgl5]
MVEGLGRDGAAVEENQAVTSVNGGDVVKLMSIDVARDPKPTYRALRDAGRVMQATGMFGPAIIAAGREVVDEIFKHPDVYSSAAHAGRLGNVRPLIPIEYDPPEQRKYRKLINPIFAPQAVERWKEPVRALVHELIDGFVDAKEIDFSKQFSTPLPSQIFLTLLGLPLDDLPTFLRLKDGIVRPAVLLGVPVNHPDVSELKVRTAQEIYAYFNDVFDERGRERKDDLLSHLIDAEVDGEKLTREELLDICFLFLTAGLDTVSASLDTFMAYLAEAPQRRAEVVANPDNIDNVVEELLRWESPVMLVTRMATKNTELAGCPVRKGEEIYVYIGSANLDEEELADADEVRFDRTANRHIAFGGGVHRCLGSHLARMELRIVLREWHARIPDYRIKPGAQLNFTPGVRSIDSFPMLLGKSEE